jgi:hypothetical protein
VQVPKEGQAPIEFPYQPPDEYDYKVVFSFAGVGTNNTVVQMVSFQGKPFIRAMGRGGFTFLYFRGGGSRFSRTKITSWAPQNGKRYTSIVKVRKDGAQAYFDGQLVGELKTDYEDLQVQPFWALRSRELLGVGTDETVVTFHSAEVAEITGTGKRTRDD